MRADMLSAGTAGPPLLQLKGGGGKTQKPQPNFSAICLDHCPQRLHRSLPLMDLFVPIVEKKKLHHHFLGTLAPTAAGVRAVLTEWSEGFHDRDRKFVREFQTTYNSSFWELYLFAVLKQLGIEVDFSFDAPDFVSANHPIAIEAAIASHANDDAPEWEKTLAVLQNKDLAVRRNASIIRLSNALLGKSTAFEKRYAALPHMAGRSYVVAISNYGTQDFYLQGDAPMQCLLFDIEKEKVIHKPMARLCP
jgi:hypothetical protein